MASISCVMLGWLLGRQIMSPLATPTGSARVIVTAMGGKASSTGPSAVSIVRMVVATPEGMTTTGSPGRKTPLATVPA